jgi:hypothetical protein
MLKLFAGIKAGPTLISSFVVLGFFGIIILLILHPASVSTDVADILKILTGTLGGQFVTVVQYHFGSSAGSKAKDDVLHQIAAGAAGGPPANPGAS